jgi:ABC-2 type transport system ATP-binding protein
MIELHHISKKYGTKLAVNDLHLTIDKGELFAFLGPNGAGKTTTIKMMCGLLFPTSGIIRIAGFDLATQGQEARQQISFVPDTPYLYEKLTGREILHFIANMYRMSEDNAQARIDEMIELFNLYSFVDDLTQNYSHGMRQRTVFAAALLHQPEVLIVDEPTVGLDPRSIRLLKDVLRNETKRGATVFLSTHSLDIAQELSDRIGVINQGRLISCGTLDQLRDRAELNGTLEEVFLKLTEEETPELKLGARANPVAVPMEAAIGIQETTIAAMETDIGEAANTVGPADTAGD